MVISQEKDNNFFSVSKSLYNFNNEDIKGSCSIAFIVNFRQALPLCAENVKSLLIDLELVNHLEKHRTHQDQLLWV